MHFWRRAAGGGGGGLNANVKEVIPLKLMSETAARASNKGLKDKLAEVEEVNKRERVKIFFHPPSRLYHSVHSLIKGTLQVSLT